MDADLPEQASRNRPSAEVGIYLIATSAMPVIVGFLSGNLTPGLGEDQWLDLFFVAMSLVLVGIGSWMIYKAKKMSAAEAAAGLPAEPPDGIPASALVVLGLLLATAAAAALFTVDKFN